MKKTYKNTSPQKKKTLTMEKVVEVLTRTNWAVGLAAKELGCTRNYLQNFIDKYPTIIDKRIDFDETVLDMAEQILINKAIEGKSLSAIKFLLESKAKHRGYGKQVNNGNNKQEEEGEVVEVTDVKVMKINDMLLEI